MPDHPPEAVQAVAFADDQVSIDVAPLLMLLGLATRLSVGAAALTDTVTDCVALAPDPVQVSPKVELDFRAPVDWDPVSDLAPAQAPEAVHAVALVTDQAIVELSPFATVLGDAARLMTAAGLALTVTVVDWVALPPAPVHVNT